MSRTASTNIQHIAAKAGCSHATVSRALNGRREVAEHTRQHVLGIAKSMGYKPNLSARMLVAQRSGNMPIAVEILVCNLSPEIEDAPGCFTMQMIQGIQDISREDGHVDCHINYWHDRDPASKERLLERIMRLHGIIVMGHASLELIEMLVGQNVDVVLADQHFDQLPVDAVVSDNFQGGVQIADHLLKKGHPRMGWLGGTKNVQAWAQRLAGTRARLAEAGLTIAQQDCRWADRNDPQAFELAMEQWIRDGDLPSVIITPTAMAVVVMQRALTAGGLRCPDDVELFCFDDDIFIKLCRPEPTRVATYPVQIGRKAMQQIVSLVRHDDPSHLPHKTVVPVKLIEGQSLLIETASKEKCHVS